MSTVGIAVTEGLVAPVDSLRRDAETALAFLGRPTDEISILLTNDSTIQPLNRLYRGIDGPTDVLSFSQMEGPPTGQVGILGDVVISIETATRQAATRGHDIDQELRILLVHGILHLLGHDHVDDGEAAVMEGMERQVLAILDEDEV